MQISDFFFFFFFFSEKIRLDITFKLSQMQFELNIKSYLLCRLKDRLIFCAK